LLSIFSILDDLTKRLINTHPEQANVIIEQQKVIQNQWTDLTSKADFHKVENRSLFGLSYLSFVFFSGEIIR
jgi:hypothetical protein